VIPCRSKVVRRLAQDPRVRELLWSVQAQHAPVVVSAGSAAVLGDLHLVPPPNGSLVTFSFEEDLPAFAQGLVGLLLLPAG
jgi:hypothetical protein